MRKNSAAAKSIDSLRGQLRAVGLRTTPARLAVMQELVSAESPITHAEMAERLSSQGFDRATIYRNLIELADVGLVFRVELGDHVWRFELRRSSGEHPHFVCVDCGEVSCLPSGSVSLNPSPGAKHNAISEVTEVLLKGRCGQCG